MAKPRSSQAATVMQRGIPAVRLSIAARELRAAAHPAAFAALLLAAAARLELAPELRRWPRPPRWA